MTVSIGFDLGAAYLEQLRTEFPQVRFVPAYTPEERLAVASEVEVQFGLIEAATFAAARQLRWFHFVGIGFTASCAAFPTSRPVTS